MVKRISIINDIRSNMFFLSLVICGLLFNTFALCAMYKKKVIYRKYIHIYQGFSHPSGFKSTNSDRQISKERVI